MQLRRFYVGSQLIDMFVTGKALRGFVLALWLNKDGPEKAREWLELTMQLLADGVMTPPTGDARLLMVFCC